MSRFRPRRESLDDTPSRTSEPHCQRSLEAGGTPSRDARGYESGDVAQPSSRQQPSRQRTKVDAMPRTETTTKHPRYATLHEAAEYCRSSRRSLERRMAEGKLTRFRNGFRVLVDLNEIDALLRGDRR